MVTLHSNKLVSSTKPAENPSTGFLQRSGNNQKKKSNLYTIKLQEKKKKKRNRKTQRPPQLN